MNLGIDLNVLGEDYKGGVGRYAISLTIAILSEAKNRNVNVFIICNDRNISYLRSKLQGYEYTEIIDHLFGTEVYKKLHAFSYLLYRLPIILRVTRGITSGKVKKKLVSLDILYSPTTYLNIRGKFRSAVSLHDTQEVAFPENFTNNQHRYRQANRQFTLQYANLVQVSSCFIKNELSRITTPHQFENICIIPEGVDSEYFTLPESGIKQTSELRVLVPANFHTHKNHIKILEACQQIETLKKIQVRFVGEGTTFQRVSSLAKDMRLEHIQFVFLGKIDDEILRDEYKQAHIVLSASSYESSSLPLLEGLASGCIALASNIEAHLEMARRYPIELFQLNSPESLARNIENIIHNSETSFTKTALQARRESILKSDWHLIAHNFLEEFEKELL